MAISTYTEYMARSKWANRMYAHKTFSTPNSQGIYSSGWTAGSGAAVAPTTAVACSNSTAGALNGDYNIGNDATNTYVISKVDAVPSASNYGTLIFLDRLSHQGGLDATVTTAQTTNLPTAALTRYTSGEGVWLLLEIYNPIGSTTSTITASYTNQDGTSGRTTKVSVFGGSFQSTRLSKPLPLQDGDTGVRSVESVTVAATTGQAGNFGITLAKPLYFTQILTTYSNLNGGVSQDSLIRGGGQFEPALNGACIYPLFCYNNSSLFSLALTYMSTT